MLYFPNAKINIGLYVTEKRADGFHNLETIFYPVGLKDVLEVLPAPKFSSNLIYQDFEGENICTKAYQLLKKKYPDIPAVNINLLKNIPIGAGLGGGSSDAAFTLKALKEQFSLEISETQLLNLAGQLGADCAFFIKNSPVFAYEKGDVFEPIALNLDTYQIVLAMPDLHISTAEAYQNINPKPSNINLKTAISKPIEYWKNEIENDFEAVIFPKYRQLREVKEELYHQGAIYAAMSGSGACLYGIFHKNFSHRFSIRNTQFYYIS